MGQVELARSLTEHLGRSIDKAAVNKMLKEDGRKVSADEMIAIEAITGYPAPTAGIALHPTSVRLAGIIGAGGAINTDVEQPDPGIEIVAEIKAQLPRATTAYEIVGTSMMPFFRPGSLIVCGPEVADAEAQFGDEVACCDIDGNRFLKILHPGSKPGHYDLQSHNADLMRDVRLQWVAEIIAIIPEKQWRRIERTGGIVRPLRAAE